MSTSIPGVPPPTYSQNNQLGLLDSTHASDIQLLICPPQNSTQFQKGYLGANDEHAAVEGEIQIKGAPIDTWDSVSVSLRSLERAGERKIELAAVDVELYSRMQASGSTSCHITPSSIPFSVPLTPDTPECLHIRSGRSSVEHNLTATLRLVDPAIPPVLRSITVHTRRYSAHGLTCPTAPKKVVLTHPTNVEVQVPRSTFAANEVIPVYVTIPPPPRNVVLEEGLSLRNVWAELLQSVMVHRSEASPNESDDAYAKSSPDSVTQTVTYVASQNSEGEPSNARIGIGLPQEDLDSRLIRAERSQPRETVISRSGSSCCFHSSRPIRLRFLLRGGAAHQNDRANDPAADYASQHTADSDFSDAHANCASISQTTIFHTVSYRLQIRVAFLHVSNRSEQTFVVSIPITLLPPPAPLPEVDPSMESAYMKKHDKPPPKTVRRDDSDLYWEDNDQDIGGVYANHAGPSALGAMSGAPPPFDDAPPPFSMFSLSSPHATSRTTEAASSSRLPTFEDSEAEVIVPEDSQLPIANTPPLPPLALSERPIEGEGRLFGFAPSEQYDGYSYADEPASGLTCRDHAPPSLELANSDADITELADLSLENLDLSGAERVMNALAMVLEQRDDSGPQDEQLPPPPPPPLDDPSDPPPSIDSEFRSRSEDGTLVISAELDPPPPIDSQYRAPERVVSSGSPRFAVSTHQGAGSAIDQQRTSLAMNHDEANSTRVPSRSRSEPGAHGSSGEPSFAPPPYLNSSNFRDGPNDVDHVLGPPPYVDLELESLHQRCVNTPLL